MMANAVAQRGAIKGKVVNNSNEPLPNVNISITGMDLGTQTDIDGHFEIKNIPNGLQGY